MTAKVNPPTRIAYQTLPTGTLLEITSTKGNHLVVELLDGLFKNRSRNVKVIVAPTNCEFDDSYVPTHLFAVPAQLPNRPWWKFWGFNPVMGNYYGIAIPDFGPGNVVFLLDYQSGVPATSLEVASFKILPPR